MTKLTDIQHLLLTTAAGRPDGSLLPPCDLLGELSDAIRKAIRTLLRRGLAKEIDAATTGQLWRTEADRQIGLRITDAGRAAVGQAGDPVADDEDNKPVSKIAQVLGMLRNPAGCTLDDIVCKTGWLPHSSRAALTGLRKKGHVLTSENVDGVRRYRSLETVA